MAKVYCVTTTFYVAETEEAIPLDLDIAIEKLSDEDWEVLHVEEEYAVDRLGFNPLLHLCRVVSNEIARLTPEVILEQDEEE